MNVRVVQLGDVIEVHYSGRLKDGTVFDTTAGRGPMTFKVGGGQTVAGFEEAVLEMSVGQKKTVIVPTHKGFGAFRRNMERVLDSKFVPAGADLKVGQFLRISHPDGSSTQVKIINLSRGQVVVDMNHPLAGQDLVFEIQLLAIL
jgi:peptidylprolyl isomerase